MPYQFDEHDAHDLTNMIRRRRPQWSTQGIMRQLQQAAERNATISQATSAAEKTWSNPKANTPAALMWSEHWEEPTGKRSAVTGERLCTHCDPPRRHPMDNMSKESGSWKCLECTESN